MLIANITPILQCLPQIIIVHIKILRTTVLQLSGCLLLLLKKHGLYQLDATDWFLYCKTYCSLNMFRAPLCPSSGAQELYRWLLPVVLGALVYRSLVCHGAVGYVSGLRDVSQ